MGVGCVDQLDRLAIEMDRHGVGIGDRRKGAGRRRRDRLIEGGDIVSRRHPDTDVVLGDDDRAGLRQGFIAAEMVGVGVGVDDEPDRLVAQPGDGRLEVVNHRRDGGVDQEDSVGAGQHQGISAHPAQQIDSVAEIGRLDLELGEIGPWLGGSG